MTRPPIQRHINNGKYKQVDGVWFKLCTGPSHDEPTYLPRTEKYFYRRHSSPEKYGEFTTRCRLCQMWAKSKNPGEHGYIPLHEALPFYVEATNRIGISELARRTGMSAHGIRNVLYQRHSRVQKAKLKLVMLELISSRLKNERLKDGKASNVRAALVTRANGGSPVCAGCGRNMMDGEYTEGCRSCDDRRSKRKSFVDKNSPQYKRSLELHNKRRKAKRAAAKGT